MRSYNNFLREGKEREGLRNKVYTCHAASLVFFYSTKKDHIERAQVVLREFGITSSDHKIIKSSILREKSRLETLDKKNEIKNKKEEINFFRLVAKVEQALGYSINIDKIVLAHWLEIIKSLADKKPLSNTIKNGRKGN